MKLDKQVEILRQENEEFKKHLEYLTINQYKIDTILAHKNFWSRLKYLFTRKLDWKWDYKKEAKHINESI
jgi:hypothetical protein